MQKGLITVDDLLVSEIVFDVLLHEVRRVLASHAL